MKIGILGSGFGIYGYLPATCKNWWSPIILEKNRNKTELRPELNQYKNKITYVQNEKTLIENSEALIVATTPKFQFELLKSCNLKSLNHLYLEKPIAPSIENYLDLIEFLESTKVRFSVAYLFIYTSWYEDLRNLLRFSHGNNLKFVWSIKKIESSWKNSTDLGGGLLYFYGIHFLALLYHLGVLNRSIQIIENFKKVDIVGVDSNKNKIHIVIDFAENSCFEVKLVYSYGDTIIFKNPTPFGPHNKPGVVDTRVDLISRYLKDFNVISTSTSVEIEKYIYSALKSRQIDLY